MTNNQINSAAIANVAAEYGYAAKGYAWGSAAIAGNVVSGALGIAASVLQFGADVIGAGAEYASEQSKTNFQTADLMKAIREGKVNLDDIMAQAQAQA